MNKVRTKAMVLTSPERQRITLFSQLALISQLCPHYFEKLTYYNDIIK